MEITFTDPLYLFLLFSVPLLVITHYFSSKYSKMRAIRFANFEALRRTMSGKNLTRSPLSKHLGLLVVRCFTLTVLILAAAGPVVWYTAMSSDNNYVIALDSSGSMLAADFSPNRFEAAKQSAVLFASRFSGNTKIGVVSFAGISYIEHRLNENFQDIKASIDAIEIKPTHGTAIGDALKSSSNLLLAGDKPGVIILITDGRENVASETDFGKVITYLQDNHIIVNTIGIGTEQGGKIPGIELITSIDEAKLQKIASVTGGKYFRADSEESLKKSYDSLIIESMAKLSFDIRFILILLALILLFNEWGLVSTKFRTVP